MKPLGIDEIKRAVHGRWLSLPFRWRGAVPARSDASVDTKPTLIVRGICTDSRQANPGEVFFALRGERYDGHDFLTSAADRGCISAVVNHDVSISDEIIQKFPAGVIAVADTVSALGDLAEYYRTKLTATVVAITGSNGKTTVKEMVHHILSKRMKGSAAQKSYNNAVGVPLTLLAAEGDDTYIICEAGTNRPGEIANLARIIKPDIAVITSVHKTHLEGLGSIERVAVEKASLLSGLSPGGLAVLWADSELLKTAVDGYDVKTVWFGEDSSADLRLTDYRSVSGGGKFQMNDRLWVNLAVPGKHNALNALAAIAVAGRFGIPPATAADDLKDYTGTKMRLESINIGGITIINDAYNSNPASLRAGVAALESYPGKRRIVVAGDMAELGPSSEQMHRLSGKAIAAMGVGLIVGVGKLGKFIADGADSVGGVHTERISSVQKACKVLPTLLKPGDVILIKGSRVMRMERLVEAVCSVLQQRKGKRSSKRRVRTC